MITCLRHSEIDKKRWDACIQNAVNGNIYAYSWYLDKMCAKWDALTENDYESVFPLTGGFKYGIHYLYQPFFTQQLGIFSQQPLSDDIVNRFIAAIPPKYKFIEINLNTSNRMAPSDFSVRKNVTLELNLDNPYEEIYRGYSENAKRNIKKAMRNKIRVESNTPPEAIIALFRNHKGRVLPRIRNKHYQNLKEVIYLCMECRKATSWGAYTPENKLCAGAFFLDSDNKVILLFLATGPEAKQVGAASLIIDRCIRENAQRNAVFDFEGSNHPGLARFYKSFGSQERVYLSIRKNNLPRPVKWIKG